MAIQTRGTPPRRTCSCTISDVNGQPCFNPAHCDQVFCLLGTFCVIMDLWARNMVGIRLANMDYIFRRLSTSGQMGIYNIRHLCEFCPIYWWKVWFVIMYSRSIIVASLGRHSVASWSNADRSNISGFRIGTPLLLGPQKRAISSEAAPC